MEKLERVIGHLQNLPHTFYGRVILMVKNGRIVHLIEERSIKLDDEQDPSAGTSKDKIR
jgi:hypothetical protein